MTVEVRPLGVKCNLACDYCYQEPQRQAGNVPTGRTYDLDAIMAAVEAEGGPFVLFGGEPLLLPLADLERLWSWGHRMWGRNGIQTNATLITDRHLELFRKFRVHVGVSLDGPGRLNAARRARGAKRTDEMTARTEAAIARLCAERIPMSLIITLHRGNASPNVVGQLVAWVRHVHRLGVKSLRLHLLESESALVRSQWGLSPGDAFDALAQFARLRRELPGLAIDLFDDMRRLLRGEDEYTTCIWNACDPYTTRAVRGVEGTGQRSNCGRTNKDGIDFVKSETPGYERYLALFHTPQEHGGCAGCRFFLMCKGQCPGTAIDGDWRNRTEHCETWMRLFAQIEGELVAEGHAPLSLAPFRRDVELALVKAWSVGKHRSVADALETVVPGGLRRDRPLTADFRRLVEQLVDVADA